jgi:hypothetical protein
MKVTGKTRCWKRFSVKRVKSRAESDQDSETTLLRPLYSVCQVREEGIQQHFSWAHDMIFSTIFAFINDVFIGHSI